MQLKSFFYLCCRRRCHDQVMRYFYLLLLAICFKYEKMVNNLYFVLQNDFNQIDRRENLTLILFKSMFTIVNVWKLAHSIFPFQLLSFLGRVQVGLNANWTHLCYLSILYSVTTQSTHIKWPIWWVHILQADVFFCSDQHRYSGTSQHLNSHRSFFSPILSEHVSRMLRN